MKETRFYDSPAGRLAMSTDGSALTELLLQKEAEELGIEETAGRLTEEAADIFGVTGRWLDSYFSGEAMPCPLWNEAENSFRLEYGGRSITLRPEGSPFRQEVWKILCRIPYGEVVTYGSIAKKMAEIRGKKKMSAQAVGGAVGHNPIAIMIPCHRVVGAGGNLVGYGGGLPVKISLLKLEGLDMNRFTVPTKGTKL